MDWLLLFLLASAMALAAWAPAYFWLRAVRIPPGIATALSPALVIIFLSVLGEVYHLLGIAWSGLSVLPLLAISTVAALWVFRRQKRHAERAMGWQFWCVVALAWLIAALPWISVAPADNPIQQWDPSFHMNGVWSIIGTGDAGWDTALAPNYAARAASEYPPGWHIFVALFATQKTVLFAANASTLALMLLWVVGAGVYTRVLFSSRIAWTIAPLLAAGMLSMPADALGAYSQWPNATSVALMPGIAAYLVWLGRKAVRVWGGRKVLSATEWIAWPSVLLLGCLGGIRAHPVIGFNLLFLLAPAIIAGLIQLTRIDYRRKRWWAVPIWPATFALGVAAVLFLFNTAEVRNMGDYPRPGQSWAVALGTFLTPTPPYGRSISLTLWLATVAILMILALFYYASAYGRNKSIRLWPLMSFLVFAGLVLIAYGPDSAFREFIVAPWFLDARRIMEPQNLSMVPLAALGFAWVVDNVASISQRVTRPIVGAVTAVVVVAVSGGLGLSARAHAFASVYDPQRLGKPGMATQGELDMLRSLDEILPADAVILGDPQNGSVYAQVIGQRKVVFPQLTLSGLTDDQTLLRQSFKDLATNPQVCEAVKRLGVTHFYSDEDGYYYQTLRSERTPGLYNVNPADGLELVAEGDTARLYRITACN
ncbi:hypothetical protein FYJ24_06690 [Actinomycetaceae bacterium WB03_NA08]|uniref:Transmembrane protein n=1 Tax=Scrofimicrobium canadense TaxID=2652290 RepID=A0A6N7VRP8_9ACTO|nr:DUF6541 family protein [Scrofimicrobium canadense]MSS84454.1 hypothetical protein [Scrofimicrobium canadense]